ncbi:hypothetical protein ACHAWF_013849 [Thalassiosira exigua]
MYEREKSELRALRSHLLALTSVPGTSPPSPGGGGGEGGGKIVLSPSSPAVRAAITGLDKELSRLEREERLVRKFRAESGEGEPSSAMTAGSGVGKVRSFGDEGDEDVEYVRMGEADAVPTAAAEAAAAGGSEGGADDDDEEWEDANPSPSKRQDRSNTSGEDFQTLASAAVARIAASNVKASTPLGALALALHAALLERTASGTAGDGGSGAFRCTGVPDAGLVTRLVGDDAQGTGRGGVGGGGGGGGGFAAPVRELPRSRLVPSDWEDAAKRGGDGGTIAFRYKCGREVRSVDSSGRGSDATTAYLALRRNGDDAAAYFGPLPTEGTAATKEWTVPVGRHVNLDGFAAAKAKAGGSGGVSPSLLYVSLPDMLGDFHNSLGALLPAETKEEEAKPVVGAPSNAPLEGFAAPMPSVPFPSRAAARAATFRPDVPPDGMAVDLPRRDPLRADDPRRDPLRASDSRRDRRGDFEGDLLPGGPQPGGLHDVPRPGMGSQVGPDHPMFDRTFGDDPDGGYDDFGGGYGGNGGNFGIPGVGGGMGMRPRFDPYGPPGGPTEPGRGAGGGRFPGRGSRLGRGRGRGGRGRAPPGGFGDPNPDHMTPPGGDYFS